jgi:hypothetical protein
MDLRNKASYETLLRDLGSMPEFSGIVEDISKLAETEAEIDEEIHSLSRLILQTEIERQQAAISNHVTRPIRVHAFYMVDAKNWTLRIDNEKFSDFFNRVEFNMGNEHVVWERTSPSVQGVTLTRPISSAGTVTVRMTLGYPNQLYEVPAPFRPFIASRFCNMVDMFRIVCDYIKQHQLSSDEDPSYFAPDQVLHNMLYPQFPLNHPVGFATLLDALKTHFKRPAGPLEFTVSIDQTRTDPATTEQVFGVLVETSGEYDDSATETVKKNQDVLVTTVAQVDTNIVRLTSGIEEVKDTSLFLSRLSASPIGVISEILKNPTGVAKNVESTNMIDYTQMVTGDGFYRLPWAIAAAAQLVQDSNN